MKQILSIDDIRFLIDLFNEKYTERFPIHFLKCGALLKSQDRYNNVVIIDDNSISINVLDKRNNKSTNGSFVINTVRTDTVSNVPVKIINSSYTRNEFSAMEKKLRKVFREYGNKAYIRKFKVSKLLT